MVSKPGESKARAGDDDGLNPGNPPAAAVSPIEKPPGTDHTTIQVASLRGF